MAMKPRGQHTLAGEEKGVYLRRLDASLDALVRNLAADTGESQESLLTPFGQEKSWQWSRLPKPRTAYAALADLVRRVQEEYHWFDWRISQNKPAENRGYFESIGVSAESGLPWSFDFIELHRLRTNAAEELERIPDYPALAHALRVSLMEDGLGLEEVPKAARQVHTLAMKRNFLDGIKDATLLGWERNRHSLPPKATRVLALGGEELWNLTMLKYSPSSSMFHAYVIDLWQDIRDPQITPGPNNSVIIAPALEQQFSFGDDNAAWYILKTLDEKFKSLHPVHVTRALIGPFENKYLTRPDGIDTLPITGQLLAENPETMLLRCSRQYSYAPNHEMQGQELRQIVHREDWRDEYIVSPAAYASRVASSVLGERVKVVEA